MIQRNSSGGGKMSLWFLVPISLPVFTLPGIWIIYMMALYNQHICPVNNWVYNSTCETSLVLQSGSRELLVQCAVQHCFIRGHCDLFAGWFCAAGLMIVGNFQVDHAKVLHYVGAGLAFPSRLLFVCVQTLLSYHAAEMPRDFQMAHLRLTLTALAFTTLILNIHCIQCS